MDLYGGVKRKRMKTRAVIFDLFGTLVDSFSTRAHQDVLRRMAETTNVDATAFVAHWNATTDDRALGKHASIAEAVTAICRDLGREIAPETAQRCESFRVALTRQYMQPRPGACETLAAIRARGLRTGLISDFSAEGPAIWRETLLAPLFDYATFSCDVKLKKPDPAIYRWTCQRLEVAPEECLYVGDGGSRELTGAATVGMRPIRIVPPHAAEYDPHVLDADAWRGPVIEGLGDVLGRVEFDA